MKTLNKNSILTALAVLFVLLVLSITAFAAGPATINLGSAGDFVILAKSGVSTTGATSITGDIGVSPITATAITGFGLIMDSSNAFSTSSLVTGEIYAADYTTPTPAKMSAAISDMEAAYTDAAGRTIPIATELGAGNIGGMTLAPGLYKWSTGVTIPTNVILSGGADDVWIFQIAQNLTISSSMEVVLSGGAQASNIFWQVAGQTTLGTNSVFNGNILDQAAIILNTGATLNGRALAQTAVTLDANVVLLPLASASVKGSESAPTPVNGSCSSTHYNCNVGTSVNKVVGYNTWTWACNGFNFGTTALCSEARPLPSIPGPVTTPVNGACSSVHYSCSAGTSANNVSGATAWDWVCNGLNAGTNTTCSEAKPLPSIVGAGSTSTASQVNGLCSSPHYSCNAGISANNIDGATAWTWSCIGFNSGTIDSCLETKSMPVTPDPTPPIIDPINGSCSSTHYNCNVGTSVNKVVGYNTWTWACNGFNFGTTALCSEARPLPSTPASALAATSVTTTPGLPNTGISPDEKTMPWNIAILASIFGALGFFYIVRRQNSL